MYTLDIQIAQGRSNQALHPAGDGVLPCTGLLLVAARRAARLSASPWADNVVLPRRVNASIVRLRSLSFFLVRLLRRPRTRVLTSVLGAWRARIPL